jgi:hypothetical protein
LSNQGQSAFAIKGRLIAGKAVFVAITRRLSVHQASGPEGTVAVLLLFFQHIGA